MFDTLKTLFAGDDDARLSRPDFESADPRLAEAALMFHVIVADGVVDESEKEHMQAVLKREYGLDDGQFADLF